MTLPIAHVDADYAEWAAALTTLPTYRPAKEAS
jgi:hypothetical protein